MAEAVLVVAEESSALIWNAPTYEAIRGALIAARLGDNTRSDGAWVGPGPRVTRVAQVGALRGFVTRVAWLYGVGDGVTIPRTRLRDRVAAELDRVGSWSDVTVVDYAPAVNGSLEWWLTGAASQTQTRDEFPTGSGRVDATENPIGPTTPETHPTSPAELGRAVSGELGEVGMCLAVVAFVGAVLYVAATHGGD